MSAPLRCLILPLLSACGGLQPQLPIQPPDTSGPGDSDSGPGPGPDTADTASPVIVEETVGAHTPDDAHIFSTDRIHEIALEIPHDSWSALGSDPYTYQPGRMTFDGETVDEVGVRLRGKIGSFRTLTGKPKLKIDFNRFHEDQRFYGLESLSLNNSVVDCSYLKEAMASHLYQAAEVPTSRAAFASVSVNGADYGLYIIIETQDDRFLDRNWEDPSGNLYDGKYVWYGGGSYTLLDFAEGNDVLYQLEEGEDVDHVDIGGVSAALSYWYATDQFYTQLGEVVDWPTIHRAWAVEQWVGQNDGYCLNKNNNRVYFDPEDGKAELVPWDYDYSFLNDSDWGRSWASPYGNLAYACAVDATCRADWQAAAAEVVEIADAADMPARYDEWATLTRDAAMADPRRECSAANIDAYRAHVDTWVDGRSDYMRSFWGL